MLVRYEGPPDQYDFEVAQALALARDHATDRLPDQRDGAGDGATVEVTNPATDAPAELEPGRVYDLPARLAEHRLETSAHWTRVARIADLPDAELHRLAGERGVTGRSKLSGRELAKAVSAATPATLPDPDPPAEGGAAPAGGGAPAPAPAATPAAATTTGVTT